MSLESAFEGGRGLPNLGWHESAEGGMTYWVIGGEYEDTSFQRIAGGKPKERHGPFATREEAMACWRTKAMSTVDNACVRFHLEKVGGEAFWVVGGRYKDTRFAETRDGGPEERIGPFRSFEEAKAAWRAKAMETVDDALARYRVEGA
jgi:hypothetical protein